MRDEAAAALASWGIDATALVPLAGDASTRRYLRGREGSGAPVVVMDCGEPLPGVEDGRDGFAFTRWQAVYRSLGIRVPEILGIARDAGLVLLEDLGDELLQSRVEARGPVACLPFYRRAMHWGRVLSEDGARACDPAADPDEDPLVPARLALEMDLLLAHAAGPLPEDGPPSPLHRAARVLDAAGGGAIGDARALLHRLCEDVHAFGEMAPCHRDYHARNLLLVPGAGNGGEEVAVIDFQDTRRGPRAYDLASLAWDPYVTLPGEMIATLVEGWRPVGVGADDWDVEVRLAAGQRLLKAAGSFAYLSRSCGRPAYAQWLPVALGRARERLSRWPQRDALFAALEACGVG